MHISSEQFCIAIKHDTIMTNFNIFKFLLLKFYLKNQPWSLYYWFKHLSSKEHLKQSAALFLQYTNYFKLSLCYIILVGYNLFSIIIIWWFFWFVYTVIFSLLDEYISVLKTICWSFCIIIIKFWFWWLLLIYFFELYLSF